MTSRRPTARHEEQQTRQAWAHTLRIGEIARQEELARMRAEERSTRAFLDLELQEVQLLDEIRRQADEIANMALEEDGTRELTRLEKVQMVERGTMSVEDVRSMKRELLERSSERFPTRAPQPTSVCLFLVDELKLKFKQVNCRDLQYDTEGAIVCWQLLPRRTLHASLQLCYS